MSSDPPDANAPQQVHSLPEAIAGYGNVGLRAYLARYREEFTEEALVAAVVKAGYDADLARRELMDLAERKASLPIRARARRIVIGLYLVGYVALVLGMFASQNYLAVLGQAEIGSVVLAVTLGIAFLIAIGWVGSKRVGTSNVGGALGVLIAVPLVLWLVVTGLCVATGAPLQWVGSIGR